VGSLASLASATPQETIKEGAGEIVEEPDAEWRKGDGESPPSFKAIFLATVRCGYSHETSGQEKQRALTCSESSHPILHLSSCHTQPPQTLS